jgi:hypothetical protein
MGHQGGEPFLPSFTCDATDAIQPLWHGRAGLCAICAVAASLLTAIYHMLKDGTAHQDLGSNHFEERSVEARAKRLVGQLSKLGFQVQLQPLATAA